MLKWLFPEFKGLLSGCYNVNISGPYQVGKNYISVKKNQLKFHKVPFTNLV